MRWPKYWSSSFSISPSNEYSGFISFKIDWFDLLAVEGTLKSLLQHPMLSICDVQYNDQTKNIEENDQFVYGKYTYRVIHIDQTQVEENGIDLETKEFNGQPFGIIRLYTRKVAGEDK